MCSERGNHCLLFTSEFGNHQSKCLETKEGFEGSCVKKHFSSRNTHWGNVNSYKLELTVHYNIRMFSSSSILSSLCDAVLQDRGVRRWPCGMCE
jgi:hypothetical protein